MSRFLLLKGKRKEGREGGREGLQERDSWPHEKREMWPGTYEATKREDDLPEVLGADLLLDLTNSTATTSTRMITTITTTTTPTTAPPTIPALNGTARGNEKQVVMCVL